MRLHLVAVTPLLISIAMSARAHAQVASTPASGAAAATAVAAPVPDSTLTPGPFDAGFAEWRKAAFERGRAGVSFLVEGTRYEVLVLTPMAVDALTPDSLVRKASRGCQLALEHTDATVESTVDVQPWDAFDAATRDRPVIAFAIMPREMGRFDCHAGLLARFAAASRGILYGRFAPYSERADVHHAEIRVSGRLEPAQLTGRASLTKLDVGTVHHDASGQLRVYADPAVFAPDADGRAARIELHVWNAVDEEPEIMPIPDQVSRAVWQQMLPWHARSLAAVEGAEAYQLDLPMPRDSALRVAHARFHRGELGPAAAAALDRLMYLPRPDRGEMRDAMLLAAASFAAHAENAAAVSLVSDIMEEYPCLTLSSEVPETLRLMVDIERMPARCTSIPLPVIALRSAVPGWGQATGPLRKRLALTILASTAGSYLLSNLAQSYARGQYEEYLAYRGNTDPKPEAIIGRAQLARNIGNGLSIAAATLWIGAAVEAVWHEHQHARALAEVRDIGVRDAGVRDDEAHDPGVRDAGERALGAPVVRPTVSPWGVGLTISLSFR